MQVLFGYQNRSLSKFKYSRVSLFYSILILAKEIYFSQPDTLNFVIGIFSSQKTKNQDLPIAYFSTTLNESETNCTVTEHEFLAII